MSCHPTYLPYLIRYYSQNEKVVEYENQVQQQTHTIVERQKLALDEVALIKKSQSEVEYLIIISRVL